MKALIEYPEYAAILERLTSIRTQIDDAEATRRDILGTLNENERARRERSVETAAESLWQTGALSLDPERDAKLRSNLKSVRETLDVLRKAEAIGEGELQKVRFKISREVSAENRDAFREKHVTVVFAAIQLATAIAEERAYLADFDRAGIPVSFNPTLIDTADFDMSESSSLVSRLVYFAVEAGWMSGKEPFVRGKVNYDGRLKK